MPFFEFLERARTFQKISEFLQTQKSAVHETEPLSPAAFQNYQSNRSITGQLLVVLTKRGQESIRKRETLQAVRQSFRAPPSAQTAASEKVLFGFIGILGIQVHER